MATDGYIVIADITGYSAYLKASELEHAEDTLRSLLEVLIEHTKPPLAISRLEGDAVISYAPQASFLQGQTLVEMIENSYVAFRQARQRMQLNTTCTCNACRNIPNLDLKFFVHHGTYVVQMMPQYNELVGNDVNVIHRLVKNHIPEAAGTEAYAAYTERAVDKLGIQEFTEEMFKHTEQFSDVGEMVLYVQDLRSIWESERKRRRTFVEPELAAFTLEIEVPAPPPLVWDYFTKPEYRMVLLNADSMPVENRAAGRTGEGSVYYCAHGNMRVRQPVLDWRPFEYYTYETEMPMGLSATVTMRFIPIDGGKATRVLGICAKPKGPLIARTMANSPLLKPKIIAETEAGWKTLEQLILEELASGKAVRPEAGSVAADQVGAAVKSSLAETAGG